MPLTGSRASPLLQCDCQLRDRAAIAAEVRMSIHTSSVSTAEKENHLVSIKKTLERNSHASGTVNAGSNLIKCLSSNKYK